MSTAMLICGVMACIRRRGLREDKTAFLVVMGANNNGVKELLALVEGYPAAAGPTAGRKSCAI